MNMKTPTKFCDGESDATLMMKRARIMLQALVLLSLISSVTFYFLIRPATYLAITAVGVFSVTLAFVSFLECRSKGLREYNQLSISEEEVEMDVQYASIYTALAIILLFLASSVMVAATVVQAWSTVGATAVVLFLMSSLILIPYVSLFLRGAAEDQRNKLAKESLIQRTSQKLRHRSKNGRHHYISFWFLKG